MKQLMFHYCPNGFKIGNKKRSYFADTTLCHGHLLSTMHLRLVRFPDLASLVNDHIMLLHCAMTEINCIHARNILQSGQAF